MPGAPKAKATTAAKAKAAAGLSQAKSKAAAAKSNTKSRNKRAADDGDAGDDDSKVPRECPSADDQETINKYLGIVRGFQTMAVDAVDEAAFVQWTKDQLASLGEAKRDIAVKKKSLKRRKDNTEHLVQALDSCTEKITQYSDVIRKLSAGNAEGRQLFDSLTALSEVQFSRTIWLRAVRAAAFDCLKVAQWQEFFGEIHETCQEYAKDPNSDPDGMKFFLLLTTQLLQRLVKAAPGNSKTITSECLAYLKGFMDAMIQHSDKTVPEDTSPAQHKDTLLSIKAILDFSSAPSTVLASVEAVKDKPHFAAQALLLPQGKKILDAVVLNAHNKSAASEVMTAVDAADLTLSQSGLCSTVSAFSEGLRKCFTPEHGVLISKTLESLSVDNLKSVKGADRERYTRVTSQAKSAVFVSLMAHMKHELLPYIRQYGAALSNDLADMPTEPLLLENISCVMSLTDRATKTFAALVDGLKGFSKLMHDWSARFIAAAGEGDNATAAMSAQDAAAVKKDCRAKLNAIATEFSKLLDEQDKQLTAKGEEISPLPRELLTELKEASELLCSGVDSRLNAGVQTNAMDTLKQILEALSGFITNGQADFSTLQSMAEQCQLFSTVLDPEVGAAVQKGVEVVALLVACLQASTNMESAGDKDKDESAQTFIVATHKLESVSKAPDMTHLRTLNKIAGHVMAEEVLVQIAGKHEDLETTCAKLFAEMKDDCCARLVSAKIDEAALEIPDEILRMEKYADIQVEIVKKHFPMDKSKRISGQASTLDDTITYVQKCAGSLQIAVEKLADVAPAQTTYRSAIKWLPPCCDQ